MPSFPEAHALVVGIAAYRSLRPLPATVLHDANAVARALIDPNVCAYDPANVRTLLDSALADLARVATDRSTVLFYFSGHGGRVLTGPAPGDYLLPVDTVYPDEAALSRSALSATDFTAALRAIPARKLVVVLDCCHSGGLGETKDFKSGLGAFSRCRKIGTRWKTRSPKRDKQDWVENTENTSGEPAMLAPRSGSLWHRILLYGQLQLVRSEMDDLATNPPPLASPADLRAFEQRLQECHDRSYALLAAKALLDSLDSKPLRQATRRLLASYPTRLKHQGLRPVTLHFARGPAVVVFLPYYSRSQASAARAEGCFPALVPQGIYDHCSPCLASNLAYLTALLGSFQEVQPLPRQRGIRLSTNSVRGVVYHYAQRVRLSQQTVPTLAGQNVQGRIIVVTTDGGRLRIRKDRKAKTRKGRKRYSTRWREPKVLMIHAVKEVNGRVQMDRSFQPILDGTLQGPDALFTRMGAYLKELKIEEADQVLFVADGAKWIWNRASKMPRSLGVAAKKIHEAVDFYHVVEHLGKVAELCREFSARQKKRWVKKQCHRLRQGAVEEVIKEVEGLATRYPGAKMSTELGYLIRHGRENKRMAYATLRAAGLPQGSGAIESAIRRVINLRLKGAGIFWHGENAEAMLLLRCFAKAGRLQDLDSLAFDTDIHKAA